MIYLGRGGIFHPMMIGAVKLRLRLERRLSGATSMNRNERYEPC